MPHLLSTSAFVEVAGKTWTGRHHSWSRAVCVRRHGA